MKLFLFVVSLVLVSSLSGVLAHGSAPTPSAMLRAIPADWREVQEVMTVQQQARNVDDSPGEPVTRVVPQWDNTPDQLQVGYPYPTQRKEISL